MAPALNELIVGETRCPAEVPVLNPVFIKLNNQSRMLGHWDLQPGLVVTCMRARNEADQCPYVPT